MPYVSCTRIFCIRRGGGGRRLKYTQYLVFPPHKTKHDKTLRESTTCARVCVCVCLVVPFTTLDASLHVSVYCCAWAHKPESHRQREGHERRSFFFLILLCRFSAVRALTVTAVSDFQATFEYSRRDRFPMLFTIVGIMWCEKKKTVTP